MATRYTEILNQLIDEPKKWLVTGAAGFIGSNLVEFLLLHDQAVCGLDNFSTGHKKNLHEVELLVSEKQWARFHFIEGDIRNLETCQAACKGVNIVLHEAAIGSVPRSIADPIFTNVNNIDGMLNMLVAARDNSVGRFVYAASSSTYGDHPGLPKRENQIGKPLSPYAVTKYVNELYADVFAKCYGFATIGLRYFNVFGRRQDPQGAYAAVIPKWIGELMHGRTPTINGDGETSRDFCYIANVIQANILAATIEDPNALNQVYNVAVGEKTTLNELFGMIQEFLRENDPRIMPIVPCRGSLRLGDVRHSQADITKANQLLGYTPLHQVRNGLKETVEWFVSGRINYSGG